MCSSSCSSTRANGARRKTVRRFIFRIWPFYFQNLAALFSEFGRFIFRIWPLYFQNLAVFGFLNVVGFSGWVGVTSEP